MAMPKLALSDCRLRRFTAEEARTCLAGRPVVFVGDSLSRYSFLSLAAFLHNGSWPALTDCPNILHKHTWAISLQGYFQRSTDAFQGRMLCDCTTTKDESRTYEYPRANLSLYFKWWTGWPYEVHGRWGHPPFRNATPCRTPACYGSGCSTEPGECRHEHDWSLPLPTALRQVVSQLSPSAIILNSGMWRGTSKESSPPSFARAVAKAALKAVAPQRGTVVWRTTTPSLRLNVTHAWDAPFLAAPRLHVLDAWQMLRPLLAYQPVPYYDHYHPWPEVYTELNTALLNMLC
ncbi:hypothetical protein CHLNCDRAFT_140917 [Chlorella variabilis]|uniref:Uncharacterized protein n=1 Tax=Chlorella variabilis TaxID=554065 RepID=E1Z6I3_CHLVA|nr:hypothetical protein CHLNCDRAFT_140917 [Chlorella variabilis]EFN58654.1 hypothetical protein CHLNCDRAFT_140917 [Chlorella variabilis]|eukprot:XP_005850756.1 hypothetical protein CHLNCDRAFT_140917 [Chlorella variabilis]